MIAHRLVPVLVAAAALAGCTAGPDIVDGVAPFGALPAASRSDLAPAASYNLNVRLSGAAGSGRIEFRQPNDGTQTIYLETFVMGLSPNTDYLLQRAAQSIGNGCVDSGWLTLGLGPAPLAIHTNTSGNGGARFWRTLPESLIGTSYDIHFQIVDQLTGAVALASSCLQYTVNPR